VTGANNVNYIKGDWASERRMGGTLRNRDSLLGDIVNSSPMYAPDTKTLFVGANDGMLHAFNSLTGAELFTFVPAG
jgi:type IV pilus assembly protein PilY1